VGWQDRRSTIVVRMSGDTGQRLSRAASMEAAQKPSLLASGWQTLAVTAPAGVLRPGENEPCHCGGQKGALFHSLEVIAGAAPESADPGPHPL